MCSYMTAARGAGTFGRAKHHIDGSDSEYVFLPILYSNTSHMQTPTIDNQHRPI